MPSALSGGTAWARIARENVRFVRQYSGNRIFWFIGLVMLSGYAEGFGIAMFLPIFTERFSKPPLFGTNAKWSYLLPKRLPKGSYTLDTKALDKAYNVARTRVEFTVAG